MEVRPRVCKYDIYMYGECGECVSMMYGEHGECVSMMYGEYGECVDR